MILKRSRGFYWAQYSERDKPEIVYVYKPNQIYMIGDPEAYEQDDFWKLALRPVKTEKLQSKKSKKRRSFYVEKCKSKSGKDKNEH